jgi:hypothetical protein
MLEIALDAAMPLIEEGGLVCEFGVGGGSLHDTGGASPVSRRMALILLLVSTDLDGCLTYFTNQLLNPWSYPYFPGLPMAWELSRRNLSDGWSRSESEGGRAYFTPVFSRMIPLAVFLRNRKRSSFRVCQCRLQFIPSTLDVLEALHGRMGTTPRFSMNIWLHPSRSRCLSLCLRCWYFILLTWAFYFVCRTQAMPYRDESSSGANVASDLAPMFIYLAFKLSIYCLIQSSTPN